MEEHISKHDVIDPSKDISKRKKWKETKDPDYKKKLSLSSVKLPQCQICGLVCSSSSNLKKHVLVHTGDKPYECKYCSKRFTQIHHANDHQKTHTGERPFQCLICDKRFTQKSALTVHMKRHSGNKDFICEICSKVFYDKTQLKIHLRKHTGEQPYQCEVCRKSFSTITRLKFHKMIHTGEKRYSCEKCGANFREKGGLNVHMLTHLPRSFICSECGQEFKRMQSLSLHKKVHEANTNYTYVGPKQTMKTEEINKSNDYITSGEENEDDPNVVYDINYSVGKAKENDNSDNSVIHLGSDSSREYSNVAYVTQSGNNSLYTTNIDNNVKYRVNPDALSRHYNLQTEIHNNKIVPNSWRPPIVSGIYGNSQLANIKSLPPNIPTPQVVQEAMANGTLLETNGEDGQPYLIVLPKSMSEKDISFISTKMSEPVPLSTSKVLQTSGYRNDNYEEHNEKNEHDLNNVCDVNNENNLQDMCSINDMKSINYINHIQNMSNMESGAGDLDNNTVYNEGNLSSEMLPYESITLELPLGDEHNEPEECFITISDTRLGMIEIAGPELVTDGEMNYKRSVEELDLIESKYDITQSEFIVANKKKIKKEKKTRIPKSYECEQCGKNCKTSSNYITHMRSHTGERPYICAFCNTGFKQPSHLRSHILRHTGERPYLCHLCSCAFTQSSRLKAHIKSLHESGKFNSRQKTIIVRKKKIRNFYCKFCKKTFINECFKSDHMELHKPPRFMCNTCNISFKSHIGFQKHVIIHNNGPNCHLCHIQFYNESQRQSHIAEHFQPVEIPKMENLDISTQGDVSNYVNKENITNNSANIMTQEHVDQQNVVIIENHRDTLSNTNLSQRNFNNETEKEIILTNSHNNYNGDFFVVDSNIRNKNNQLDISLNPENRNMVESQVEILNLTSPNKLVEKKFIKEKKSIEIVKKSQRQSKVNNCKELDEATGNTIYKCNYCSKKFNQSANFSVHLRIHTGDRPFVCNVCTADFKQIQHLKSHMLIHTGKRPFVCQLCFKAFTQKSAMKRHQLLHRGTSNKNKTIELTNDFGSISEEFNTDKVNCKICNKEILTADIKNHMEEHPDINTNVSRKSIESYKVKSQLKTNKESWLKNELRLNKFECKNCGEIFHEISNFITHLKIHSGGQEIIICEKCGIIFKRKSALKSHIFIHHLADEADEYNGDSLETIYNESAPYKLTLKGEEDMNIEVFDTNEIIYEETFDKYKKVHYFTNISYICNLCGKQYQRKYWLMQHIQNVHKEWNFQEECMEESESNKSTRIDNIERERICENVQKEQNINEKYTEESEESNKCTRINDLESEETFKPNFYINRIDASVSTDFTPKDDIENERIYKQNVDSNIIIPSASQFKDPFYVCQFCGKEFTRAAKLKDHVEKWCKNNSAEETHYYPKNYSIRNNISNINARKLNDRNNRIGQDMEVENCNEIDKDGIEINDRNGRKVKTNYEVRNRNKINMDIIEVTDRNYRKVQNNNEVGSSNETIIADELFCRLCKLAFDTKLSFSLHCDSNHRSKKEIVKENVIKESSIKLIKENTIKENVINEVIKEKELNQSVNHVESHRSHSWNCIECNLSFITFKTFSKHEKTHKRNEKESSSAIQMSTMSKESGNKVCNSKPRVKLKFGTQELKQSYRCSFCSKSFHQKFMLDEHELQVHINNRKVEKTTDDSEDTKSQKLSKEDTIKLDNETVESKDKYSQLNKKKIHKSKNSRTIIANECDKISNDCEEILYECTVCNIKLSSAKELINHSSVHTGNLPYCCDKCPYAFSQKSHLISHYRKHKGTIMDKHLEDINRYENNVINSKAKDLLKESERGSVKH